MRTTAAILVETGHPLELVELDVPALKPGQVLVEVVYSGVCHTQLLEARGHRGDDPYLPHCLGHEGSGVVRQVGQNVNKVKPDDRVILSWIKGSGADVPGTVYRWASANCDVNAGGITTFSEHAVVSENRLTVLAGGVPLRDAALLGCALPTGFGAVLNTARVERGESVAVFGCGGVGLCAVAGAVLAGASPVIAVDVNPNKLALAARMGATHQVDTRGGDVVAMVRDVCSSGVDSAIEATGRPTVMCQALECVRSCGGRAVIVGNARHGEVLAIDPQQLNQGKRLLGSWGGDSNPDRDYTRYAHWLANGQLDLSELLTGGYTLTDINAALDDLEAGVTTRPLLTIGVEKRLTRMETLANSIAG